METRTACIRKWLGRPKRIAIVLAVFSVCLYGWTYVCLVSNGRFDPDSVGLYVLVYPSYDLSWRDSIVLSRRIRWFGALNRYVSGGLLGYVYYPAYLCHRATGTLYTIPSRSKPWQMADVEVFRW